jgi:hypothetical protein
VPPHLSVCAQEQADGGEAAPWRVALVTREAAMAAFAKSCGVSNTAASIYARANNSIIRLSRYVAQF